MRFSIIMLSITNPETLRDMRWKKKARRKAQDDMGREAMMYKS
ncbi:MAG: hypothetical protein NUV54_01610 [Candidatus Taylorbacteria bacterium]|nr:hypothetical protein [Candidatus Taylorbacteria bacterium]